MRRNRIQNSAAAAARERAQDVVVQARGHVRVHGNEAQGRGGEQRDRLVGAGLPHHEKKNEQRRRSAERGEEARQSDLPLEIRRGRAGGEENGAASA